MADPKYPAFTALDPFFEISQQGLASLVEGDYYFDIIADDAEFEFRYIFPGWPQTLNGREALMALYATSSCMARTRSSFTDRRTRVSRSSNTRYTAK